MEDSCWECSLILRLFRTCSPTRTKLLPFEGRFGVSEGIWKLFILGFIELNFSSLKIEDTLLLWTLAFNLLDGLQ